MSKQQIKIQFKQDILGTNKKYRKQKILTVWFKSNSRVGTAEHTLRQRPAALGVNANARGESGREDCCVKWQQKLECSDLRQWPEIKFSVKNKNLVEASNENSFEITAYSSKIKTKN